MTSNIAFVTFGMFIIDEIEYTNNRQPQQDLIGGAGTYAVLGARIVSGREHASKVSWIVDRGSDFPANFIALIDSWDTACIYRTDPTRLTTRAWNGYGPNEYRAFKYLTPKIRLEVESLIDEQALSKSFHMVCSPARCRDLTSKLKSRRQSLFKKNNNTTDPTSSSLSPPNPIIIWEPIPDLCTPIELRNLQVAASNVSIVSPNADELAQFFTNKKTTPMNQDEMVTKLMNWDTDNSSTNTSTNTTTTTTHIIIREGAAGSTIYFAPAIRRQKQYFLSKLHLPAYHDTTMSSKVIDPTGGGNTYLGALAVGMSGAPNCNSHAEKLVNELLLGHMMRYIFRDVPEEDLREFRSIVVAGVYAVVAASYAIEQSGVPPLQKMVVVGTDGDEPCAQDEDEEKERWNGEAFTSRLECYLHREVAYILEQIKAFNAATILESQVHSKIEVNQ